MSDLILSDHAILVFDLGLTGLMLFGCIWFFAWLIWSLGGEIVDHIQQRRRRRRNARLNSPYFRTIHDPHYQVKK